MRSFRIAGALCLLAVLGTACNDDSSPETAPDTTSSVPAPPAGPQTYTVAVDGPSTLGAENFVYGTYFPNTLSVAAGDTVTFENRASNDIHTVTLGVKSDRSDQPPIATDQGQENPAVFGPCYTTEAATPAMTSCPAGTADAPEYAGTGFWNSGALLFASAPPEAGPKTATVKLAAGIPPGPYTIACLLHPFMEATLQVVASEADRLPPAEVTAQGEREFAAAKTALAALAEPTPEPVADGAGVVASWGDELVAVNRFSPETVSIKVGQTVTWKSATSWLPHTVSFDPPFASPSEPDALLPAGTKSGGEFAGGVAHSGIFGPPPAFPAETFSLVFTKAGRYPYLCLLHPGMAGTVEVS